MSNRSDKAATFTGRQSRVARNKAGVRTVCALHGKDSVDVGRLPQHAHKDGRGQRRRADGWEESATRLSMYARVLPTHPAARRHLMPAANTSALSKFPGSIECILEPPRSADPGEVTRTGPVRFQCCGLGEPFNVLQGVRACRGPAKYSGS